MYFIVTSITYKFDNYILFRDYLSVTGWSLVSCDLLLTFTDHDLNKQ